MRWGGKQRLPHRISRDPTVTGTVRVTNGRDRPPVVVAVLGLPTRDVRFRAGHIEQGEQAGVFHHAQTLVRGQLPGSFRLSVTTVVAIHSRAASV